MNQIIFHRVFQQFLLTKQTTSKYDEIHQTPSQHQVGVEKVK